MRRIYGKRGIGVAVGALAMLLTVGIGSGAVVQAEDGDSTGGAVTAQEDGKIYSGIYLDSVDVGNMTKNEARQAYSDYLERLKAVTISFELEDESCESNMADMNLEAKVEEAVTQAYEYGRRGNVLKRYKEISDISSTKQEIPVELSMDEEYLVSFLDEGLSDYIVPAKDAGIEFSNGQLVVVEGTAGKELNAEATVDELMKAIKDWSGEAQMQVAVATNDLEPEHTTEELREVKDVLGSFDTHYSAGDPSRNNNIMNAANKISGVVLYPGEEFDTMSHLVPFTTSNGWSYAGAYLNGEVISDIGGGICQVSTTLYNAVLKAELEVTERYPHSMAVGYVQLSADAALNEGTKNLKFVNSTDTPIFIYAYASGGTMHVTIYGKEYRPAGRTVEYKNEILEVIPAGDPIETVDESQPPEYREVKQTAHTGYRAKLWKYVYENGQLTDTILVNTSSYSASPERVTIGKPADPNAAPAPAPEPAAPDPNATSTEPPATDAPPTTEPGSIDTSAPTTSVDGATTP